MTNFIFKIFPWILLSWIAGCVSLAITGLLNDRLDLLLSALALSYGTLVGLLIIYWSGIYDDV